MEKSSTVLGSQTYAECFCLKLLTFKRLPEPGTVICGSEQSLPLWLPRVAAIACAPGDSVGHGFLGGGGEAQ